MAMPPKKSLGQNFLTSEGAFELILKASGTKKGDAILEIGPGKGALTAYLLKAGARVLAVEKDDRLIPYLKEKFRKEEKSGSLTVISGDALEFEPKTAPELSEGYKIVANIPYYITGVFLRKYLESEPQPESMTILVQKEVAERIVAREGKESILSISVKAYGTPRYVATVKRGSFFPAPNVDSAILHIGGISKDFFRTTAEKRFFEVLKAGFAQKRKLLKSNVTNIAPKETVAAAFEACGIPEKARAEDLTLADWKKLSEALHM